MAPARIQHVGRVRVRRPRGLVRTKRDDDSDVESNDEFSDDEDDISPVPKPTTTTSSPAPTLSPPGRTVQAAAGDAVTPAGDAVTPADERASLTRVSEEGTHTGQRVGIAFGVVGTRIPVPTHNIEEDEYYLTDMHGQLVFSSSYLPPTFFGGDIATQSARVNSTSQQRVMALSIHPRHYHLQTHAPTPKSSTNS